MTENRLVTVAAAVVGALVLCASASAQSVECGSFETCTTLPELPTAFAVWGGDPCDVTGPVAGIMPPAGDQMLHFVCTSIGGCHGAGTGSDVHQLIDLAPIAAEVAAGLVVVTIEASFNRVTGDAETDHKFTLNVRAFAGSPSTYGSLPALAAAPFDLDSDDDPATWERVGTELDVPIDAEYLDIGLSAVEDVFNDTSDPELDGHFADDVTLTISFACAPSAGDADGNGTVDVSDLLLVLGDWGCAQQPGACVGDTNCDGATDVSDLLDVLAHWG